MHLVAESAEPGLVDMGIDLGRADVGVAEHGLHGAVQDGSRERKPEAQREREDAP